MEFRLQDARTTVGESSLCVKTPLLTDCWEILKACVKEPATMKPSCLHLKMEHMQNFGSFKIRGIVNQFKSLPRDVLEGERQLVTMSAGNYGRSFAEACYNFNMQGIVVLPEFAPPSRSQYIKNKGLKVETVSSNLLSERVMSYEKDGLLFLHPFDDPTLFYGYSSIAQEIFDDNPNTEIIVTCCGGGGLLSGISMAAKLRNPDCLVYGVEPVNANSMYRSFEAGKAVTLSSSNSIATGLSPPYAGKHAYEVCKSNVNEILLVSDGEIVAAVKALYNHGLVVEPSGAAAFAAFMFKKIPNVSNKNLVIVLTGSNITAEEMKALLTEKC